MEKIQFQNIKKIFEQSFLKKVTLYIFSSVFYSKDLTIQKLILWSRVGFIFIHNLIIYSCKKILYNKVNLYIKSIKIIHKDFYAKYKKYIF